MCQSKLDVLADPRLVADVMEKFRRVQLRKDGEVVTATFVDAVGEFLHVFDVVGGAFFKDIIRNDMRNNIVKINRSCAKFHVQTLQGMVRAEKEAHEKFEGSGAEALLWLKRSLQFIMVLFYYIITESDSTSLSTCAWRAYEETVKPCHNWLLRNMFDAGLLCLPSREKFFADLSRGSPACCRCGGDDRAVAIETLTVLRESFIELLNSIVQFYNANALEDVCVVACQSVCPVTTSSLTPTAV